MADPMPAAGAPPLLPRFTAPKPMRGTSMIIGNLPGKSQPASASTSAARHR